MTSPARARFRNFRAKEDFFLYLITPQEIADEIRFYSRVEEALKKGIPFIQYRNKEGSRGRSFHQARRIRELCHQNGALFIVNDEIDLAMAAGADGVHLGQNDFPIDLARRLAGEEKIIGISTHNLAEARAAREGGADYIGYGALFATRSKHDTVTGSLGALRDICSQVSIPVIGIGGISAENICSVAEAGAAGAAVISAVWEQKSVSSAIRNLTRSFRMVR